MIRSRARNYRGKLIFNPSEGNGMDSEFSEMMNRLSENARFALQKADLFSKKNIIMAIWGRSIFCWGFWRRMYQLGRRFCHLMG